MICASLNELLAKVITLRFNEVLDRFDDAPLHDFIKDKEIVSLRDYFFIRHDVPYLAVVVAYQLNQIVPAGPFAGERKRDESWRELVSAEDVPLFNSLRNWRSDRSKIEGVPPYLLFTNKQLAEVVQRRPVSLSQLGQIDGIGPAKLEKYGRDVLALVKPGKIKEDLRTVEPAQIMTTMDDLGAIDERQKSNPASEPITEVSEDGQPTE